MNTFDEEILRQCYSILASRRSIDESKTKILRTCVTITEDNLTVHLEVLTMNPPTLKVFDNLKDAVAHFNSI